jgi:chaperonin cofactor prefoldin
MTDQEHTPELTSYRARLALATLQERRDALAVLAVQRAKIQLDLAELRAVVSDLEAELAVLDALEEAHRETMN